VTASRVLILAALAALIAGGILLVVAIFLADGDEPVATPVTADDLACVTGDLATNPINQFGRVEERIEDFLTLEQAEAFLCHRLAYPRETQGWVLNRIRARRGRPLADTRQGIGDAYSLLDYADPARPWRYIIFRHAVLPFVDQIKHNSADEPLRVHGRDGFLSHGGTAGEVVVASWDEAGMQFRVTTVLDADFTLDDFLAILESIR
jgi:hypothetical protein